VNVSVSDARAGPARFSSTPTSEAPSTTRWRSACCWPTAPRDVACLEAAPGGVLRTLDSRETGAAMRVATDVGALAARRAIVDRLARA
jgi:hypothetical protein